MPSPKEHQTNDPHAHVEKLHRTGEETDQYQVPDSVDIYFNPDKKKVFTFRKKKKLGYRTLKSVSMKKAKK